jgi:hypothetical protein
LSIFRRPQQARQPGAPGGAGGQGNTGPGGHRGPKKEALQPAVMPVAKSMFENFCLLIFFFSFLLA